VRYIASRAKLSGSQRRTVLSIVGALCLSLYIPASLAQTTIGGKARGQTEYEMRGISSAGGTSPTVGFYLDDVR